MLEGGIRATFPQLDHAKATYFLNHPDLKVKLEQLMKAGLIIIWPQIMNHCAQMALRGDINHVKLVGSYLGMLDKDQAAPVVDAEDLAKRIGNAVSGALEKTKRKPITIDVKAEVK